MTVVQKMKNTVSEIIIKGCIDPFPLENGWRLVTLPEGYKKRSCPKCGSPNLSGALITETADERDPNIICTQCGHRLNSTRHELLMKHLIK